ncbi:uncharacterized protein [Spinacia oleracea]|uniref:Myb/SANT-like domain-containing protein n=1 Tax=Spinacia oleracea TaxID=3562 RepID=A0ABM3R9B1_SPIOL|nr:uncharacterized protein LOC130467648 [Spinacia oleracea]
MPWKVIEVEFTKRTRLTYDKNKLKNKWDWMRNRWSLWRALKGKETGLGWDHEKGTISASDEWWKNKIEENMHFKSFQFEGIEPELEYKMEKLFGVSVAQGGLKYTPVQRSNQAPPSVYIPLPPLGAGNLNHGGNSSNMPPEYDDQMSENGGIIHTQTNMDWQDTFHGSTPNPSSSPSPPPQSTELGARGSKRSSENDIAESSKRCRIESGSRKGGAALLMEKLDTMVKVVTERNIKDIELMSLEARTLNDSSNTLADSLAKLVSMKDLTPGSPEFCFACTMIEDPQKRILLNGIPDDNTRLQWIKYLFENSG